MQTLELVDGRWKGVQPKRAGSRRSAAGGHGSTVSSLAPALTASLMMVILYAANGRI